MTSEHFRTLHLKMLDLLSAEQDKRDSYPGIEWVENEPKAMLVHVNAERAKLGLGPATLDQVLSANTYASGHCDYSRKFALYCAEIVMDIYPRPRW